MIRLLAFLLVAATASAQDVADRAALEARVAQAPADADARQALSALLTAQGEPAAAVPHLVWLADHAPSDADAHRRLAQTLLWSDRPNDAADALADVIALDPADVDARVQFAQIVTWTGGADRAVAALRPVADGNPDNAQLHRILAFALLADGDPGARTQFARALALQPNDLDLLIESASLERWQGDWAVARRRLASARNQPTTAEQRARIQTLSESIRTVSAASITVGGTRVDDSNGVQRTDVPFRLDVPLTGRWTIGADVIRGQITSRDAVEADAVEDLRAAAIRFLPTVTYRPSSQIQLGLGGGVERKPGGVLSAAVRASAQRIWTTRGFALARVTAESATATDAVDALDRGIRRSSVTAESYAEPSSALSLTASAAGLVYSDDNRRVQVAGSGRWLPLSVGDRAEGLPLASVGVTAGALYEDTQTVYPSAAPYYTPDNLLTASGGLALRVVSGAFRLDGSLGLARQPGATSLEYGGALAYDGGSESIRLEARRAGSQAYSADVIGLTARFRLP